MKALAEFSVRGAHVVAAAMLLSVLAAATPAAANLFVELSYDRKVEESDIVIVGRVTAVSPRNRDRYDGTATVSVISALKGHPAGELTVMTQSRISEADPQCCTLGATYMMFLRRAVDRPAFYSVNGRFGMVRIGPARNEPEIQAIPEPRGPGN